MSPRLLSSWYARVTVDGSMQHRLARSMHRLRKSAISNYNRKADSRRKTSSYKTYNDRWKLYWPNCNQSTNSSPSAERIHGMCE